MIVLRQIPLWSDNYAYILSHNNEAVVIDAAEAGPVLEYLKAQQLILKAILNTHHHPDHIGANEDLVEATACEVYCSSYDRSRIPSATKSADAGDALKVIGLSFQILDVAAHTLGHIAYTLEQEVDQVWIQGHREEQATLATHFSKNPLLFCGDSLFLGGCGRLFEGSAEHLADVMKLYYELADNFLVCCAHEYTLANYQFAASILPKDKKLRLLLREFTEWSAMPTVPDFLGLEKKRNPFLLANDPEFRMLMATNLTVSNEYVRVIRALREAKDSF